MMRFTSLDYPNIKNKLRRKLKKVFKMENKNIETKEENLVEETKELSEAEFMKQQQQQMIDNDPNSLYADNYIAVDKSGLRPVGSSSDVFINEKGIVFTLEDDMFACRRVLIKHD